ncbi:hypothetical protein ACVWYH_003252 [Bradyrhizobium sp. GM24.11]
MMKLSLIQDQAIQALMAGAVGAETFDRLFAGIRFDKLDGTMLYAFAKDEEIASDIEDGYSIYIAAVASCAEAAGRRRRRHAEGSAIGVSISLAQSMKAASSSGVPVGNASLRQSRKADTRALSSRRDG